MNIQTNTNKNRAFKQERVEARVSPELKMRLQRAADLQGSSLSEFLLSSAEKIANDVINKNQIIQFSIEDSLAFANAIFNSSKPNKQLKKALQNYKKEVAA